MANAREKIVRFRNHPSIVVRCGRNEGRPPEMIDDALAKLMTELDPNCLYQPSSTYGRGVHSGGPYYWQPPEAYYRVDCAFKTEIGSISIPTLESVQGMMPKQDWETINDDWAEHDLTKGNQQGDTYPGELNRRYGKALNLADFVRKGQLMNYESFRAMYEGRFAQLFAPVTGVITWMSNPAQPSFVWQIYSWDLEPNAAFFATRKACEPIHIMLNEANGHLQVINNPPTAFDGTATVTIYNSDGTVASHQDLPAHAAGSAETDLGLVEQPNATAHLRFVKLDLRDAKGAIVSDNFYWRAGTEPQNDLQALQSLPIVKLETSVKRRDAGGKSFFDVTLRNPSKNLVLMSHLQLRRGDSGERVLPIYYSDNYVSMVPQESKTLSIEVATADLHGQKPLLVLDGWNVDVTPVSSADCDIALNKNALVASWPVTGIPIKWFNGPLSQVKIACGQRYGVKDFSLDTGYDTGIEHRNNAAPVDLSAQPTLYQDLFKTARVGECTYTFPMKTAAGGYTVKLIFAERDFGPKPPPKNNSAPAASEAETARPEPNRVGKRIFTVSINDKPVLKNFDICVAAGKWDKAVVEEFKGVQPDRECNITIHFQNGPASQPIIDAIEVVPSER